MRRAMVWAALGAVVALAAPAVATHVQEPTAPITGLTAKIWHYANPRVQLLPCDPDWPTDVVWPFVNTRLEHYVHFSKGTAPTEHFSAHIRVEELILGPMGGVKSIEKQWVVQWRHSNVPPHPATNPWRSVGDHTNTWFRHPGVYRVTFDVTGDESGAYFAQVCVFRVPDDATG